MTQDLFVVGRWHMNKIQIRACVHIRFMMFVLVPLRAGVTRPHVISKK